MVMDLDRQTYQIEDKDIDLILAFLEKIEAELKNYAFYVLMFDIGAKVVFDHILKCPVVYIQATYSPDRISRLHRFTFVASEILPNIQAIALEEVELEASYEHHFARLIISSLALMEKE